MKRQKRGNGPGAVSDTPEEYRRIAEAWAKRPTIRHVAAETGITRRRVARVIREGIPEHNLPPLPGGEMPCGLQSRYIPTPERQREPDAAEPPDDDDGDDDGEGPPGLFDAIKPLAERFGRKPRDVAEAALEVQAMAEAGRFDKAIRDKIAQQQAEADALERELAAMKAEGTPDELLATYRSAYMRTATLKQTLAQAKAETIATDQMQKSATELAAARITMRGALAVASISGYVAEHVLSAIEQGRMELPDTITPQNLLTLVRATDTAASNVEKAMNIERKRLGQPERTIGLEVISALEDCTDAELERFVSNGQMPRRLASAIPDGAPEEASELIEAAYEEVTDELADEPETDTATDGG